MFGTKIERKCKELKTTFALAVKIRDKWIKIKYRILMASKDRCKALS
jgi:hypothetical protein